MILAQCRRILQIFCKVGDSRLSITRCRFPPKHPWSAGAGCTRVPVWHTCIFTNCVGFKGSLFGRDAVDVHRAIAALGGNVFIQRVPCNSLNIMRVLDNFVNTFPCSFQCQHVEQREKRHTIHSGKDPCDVVCATSNDVLSSRAPCQIVHLHGCAARKTRHLSNHFPTGYHSHRKVVLGFQYSFSCCKSSGLRSLP